MGAITNYSSPSNVTINPEDYDTVATTTFASGASSTFATGTDGWTSAAITMDVSMDYDQEFIATNDAHPDGNAGDLTVNVVFTEDDGTVSRVEIEHGDAAEAITANATGAVLGATGNHTIGFEVTGLEEGCELTITYDINNGSNNVDGETIVFTANSVTGLNDCPFQTEVRYRELNQKLNSRFDAGTEEFSSFKDMLKRMKKIK